MEDKTIHYTVAFTVIFIFLLGINQLVHTLEQRKVSPHTDLPQSKPLKKTALCLPLNK